MEIKGSHQTDKQTERESQRYSVLDQGESLYRTNHFVEQWHFMKDMMRRLVF